jgi:hypothetical protein
MTRTPCPFKSAESATDRSPKDGYGVECFANIGEARTIDPDLPTPDQTSRTPTRFIGPCRGELQDAPAMRFESVPAYRMYST